MIEQNGNQNVMSFQLDSTSSRKGTYATSFSQQWSLLMSRIMLCIRRDILLAVIRLFTHIGIGLLVGTLYFNNGNDAKMLINNFRYIFFTLMFLMFTSFTAMNILCRCIPLLFTFTFDIDLQ